MFFHNQQDQASRDILATLDDTVKVYDVFGADRYLLPIDIPLSSVPYLIDKYITLTDGGPYTANTPFILDFNCLDYLDQPVLAEGGTFRLIVDGATYDVVPESGVIQLQLTCQEARTLAISISGPGYLPFETEVEVVAGA